MTHPTHTPVPHRSIAALVVVTGALMATYLLLRPYGDSRGAESVAAADAFASPLWIWSHLAGAAALVALAALWALLTTGPERWAALAGAALVLPYYGAETFALHAIGVRARLDPDVLTLVPDVRDHPVAMPLFGLGLIALSASGIAAALAWRRAQGSDHGSGRSRSRVAHAFLPLAVVAALFLPQFFLPPAGRVAYGIVFAAVAVYAALTVTLTAARPRTPRRRPTPPPPHARARRRQHCGYSRTMPDPTAAETPASTSSPTPHQESKNHRIVWIDCEMTGLDTTNDLLVEIAALVTDSELNVLGEGVDIVIHAPDAALDAMVPVVRDMHASSGLTEEIRESTVTVAEAEKQVLDYIRTWVPVAGTAPLAGNSISTDRAFIARDMPELNSYLHYRMIDVSSIKELCRRWYPRIYFGQPEKGLSHRALADIQDSIRELQYYRATAFVPQPGPTTDEIKQAAAALPPTE